MVSIVILSMFTLCRNDLIVSVRLRCISACLFFTSMCYFMCVCIGIIVGSTIVLKLSWSSMVKEELYHGIDHHDGYVDSSRLMDLTRGMH